MEIMKKNNKENKENKVQRGCRQKIEKGTAKTRDQDQEGEDRPTAMGSRLPLGLVPKEH